MMLDATMLGAAVVAVLTQLIGLVAKAIGVGLPGWVKQILALVLTTGLVNLSALHPFNQVLLAGVDVTATLNALTVWAVSTFLHDVSGAASSVKWAARPIAK